MGASAKIHIVGIGASAGGLEAISQLIAGLPASAPCAYVVLQHLSPNHRSMMAEILGRETSLHVQEAANGDPLRAGCIYVVPANCNATLRNACLQLEPAPPELVPKPSINEFFISLAAEQGEEAIGIILSGTGSDGVAGLRAIQAAGGFTLVQRPDTAKYDGMPRAAMDAGVVDHVLPPDEIARRLPQLLDLPPPDADSPPPDQLETLLQLLRDKRQVDYSGYKLGTLIRRIRRREIATGNADLSAYLHWIESNPGELDLLARDILISVTSFFRDQNAFEALRQCVQEICDRKPPDSEIRVWVAGCASGEEAYSIAILFAEVLGERLPRYRVQVFATDIDEEVLNVARRGIYPAAALTGVPPELLARHFRPVNHAYEVAKHLRDMLVFARHNLVSDPPFLRLDMVSCRNVLIYFDTPLQARVLQIFHFGLVKEGLLFLGRSESVAQAKQLFAALDRRERLFRKQGESVLLPGPTSSNFLRTPAQRAEQKRDQLLNGLVQHYALTALLCNNDGVIQHSLGQVERFLQFPAGQARLHIGDVAIPALRGEILTLLRHAQQTGKPQRGRPRKIGRDWVRICVDPVRDEGGTPHLVLILPERMPRQTEDPPPTSAHRAVEDELSATREHLQTLVEEMATANEEMQALNEESQAANEELQASNEELEAANEELQATNQELVSLNEELNAKTLALAQLTTEYTHLYDALQFPILVFDRGTQLCRYNAPAERRFDLRPTALRQHVSHLHLLTGTAQLEPLLHEVLNSGLRTEVQVAQDGRTLRLTVTPGLDPTGQVTTLVVSLIDITDLTQALAQLTASQTQLSALMEKTQVIFAMKSPTGVYTYANRRFIEYFGIDTDYVGKTDFQLLPQNLATDLWALDIAALRARSPMHGEHTFNGVHGHHLLQSTHQALFDTDGRPTSFIIEATDITETRRAEDQLRITARVFNQAGEAIVVTNAKGVIQTVNAAFTTITGFSHDEAIGSRIAMLQSGRHSKEFYESMWQTLAESGFWQGEIWNRRKNSEIYPEWLTINRIDNGEGQAEHYVAVFSDTTQVKDSQRKAEYLATHDPLTGLPNRALFHDHIRHALAQARRRKGRVALLFIDLDNFKTINDTLGHDVGDEILKQAANRLRDMMRDVDTVARLGGDEFTALLIDCDAEGADRVARRIVDDLSSSFDVSDRKLFVTASIGVAFYPEDGDNVAELIKKADAAMYRAKEQGRNRVEFFKPDLHIRLLKQAALESGLREALRARRLRLVFQPKYSLTSHRTLIGAEALLRWQDPALGAVPPNEFIPVAETCGLITEVDNRVQEMLLEHLATWRELGLQPPPIAFNASPRSIREQHFSARLLGQADAAQVPYRLLQVEITESALLESSSSHVIHNLDTLHQAGVGISVDDFGTGYSSLSYLKRLPIDGLKIDKSFVDGLGQDKEDEAITRAVLGLANALGLSTVAEGIETTRQLDWLIQHGCKIGQGYYLHRPLEAEAFEDLIAQHMKAPA